MSNLNKILDSFKIKDSLNPKIWENASEPKKAKLIPKIRKALEKISEEFIDDLGDDVFVDDVHLMGSLANFNWSEFSDFDLHIMIDFERYGKEEELYKELFDMKKKLFNLKHNIKIFGYDVEVYAQDSSEKAHSDGVYSIMENEWVSIPKKTNFKLDEKLLKNKIKCWTDKIDDAIEDAKETGEVENLKNIKEKLKDYRQSGLEKKGELSYENLVFKYLRRSGHIEKLFDLKNKIKDKKLSVERIVTESSEIDVQEVVSNSSFLKELMNLVDEGLTFENTPGQKIPFDENVKKIQEALQFLGFLLPKWGVDGKYGPETEGAVKDFQGKYQLTQTGKILPLDIKFLIAALIVKDFRDSNLSSIQYRREGGDGIFTYLDLNNTEDLETYRDICQKFINHRNPNAFVTGDMMANCAKKYFSIGYVPPELALAQLTLEGGLSKKTDVKPIKTKNPFNVGNTDSGAVNVRPSFEDGVCLYYDLMTRRYLAGGKTADELLVNFVNLNGNRYASASDYEEGLSSLVDTIKKVTQPTA